MNTRMRCERWMVSTQAKRQKAGVPHPALLILSNTSFQSRCGRFNGFVRMQQAHRTQGLASEHLPHSPGPAALALQSQV